MDILRTLGKTSAKLIANLYDQNKIIFSISDVSKITGLNYFSAGRLISELKKRRIISSLKKGKHIIIPQELGTVDKFIGNWYVAAREVVNSSQYYIAFYSAMQHWGMLTQPITEITVATPRRQSLPQGMRGKLIIIYVNKKFIWGVKEDWVSKTEKVRFSDLEKTIIDCLSYPEHCGGITEIAKGIWIVKNKIDYKKLSNYVDKYNKNVVAKRLGYILETLKIGQPLVIKKLKQYLKNRYDLFDPNLPRKNLDKNDWRLVDNIGQKAIINLIKT